MRTGLSNMAARPLANGLILMIRVRIPPINLGQDSHLCMKQWSRSPKIDGFLRSSVFWVKKFVPTNSFRRKTSKVESPENKSFKLKLIPAEAAAAEKKINKTKHTTWIWSGCQKFSSIKFWRAEVRLRPSFEASPLCLSLFFFVVEALKNWWDTLNIQVELFVIKCS